MLQVHTVTAVWRIRDLDVGKQTLVTQSGFARPLEEGVEVFALFSVGKSKLALRLQHEQRRQCFSRWRRPADIAADRSRVADLQRGELMAGFPKHGQSLAHNGV